MFCYDASCDVAVLLSECCCYTYLRTLELLYLQTVLCVVKKVMLQGNTYGHGR